VSLVLCPLFFWAQITRVLARKECMNGFRKKVRLKILVDDID
jgi:hypothetical protein